MKHFSPIQAFFLLGNRDESLHGNCKAEGSQEALGHAHPRKLPAQKCKVPSPAHTLPDIWLVSDRAGTLSPT